VFIERLFEHRAQQPAYKTRRGKVYLNDVPAYTGFAAVDILIGATAMPDDDPRNRIHPENSIMAADTSSKN